MIFLRLNSGYKMPILGLGTWMYQNVAKELEDALNYALEIDYRHFDTATLYNNEKTIGNVFKKWVDSGKVRRDELFITTKLPPIGNYPERVEKYINRSLQDLQLNYIDLYLIHCPDGIKEAPPPGSNTKDIVMDKDVDLSALWQKMEEQVTLGKAKSIGISNFNIPQIERILSRATIKPACLQIELNVYIQQRKLVEFCRKHDIAVVGYCPLGSPGINNFYSAYNITKQIPKLLNDRILKQIAVEHSKTPAQVALRFLVQQNLGAIPKSINLSRIKENFDIFNFTLEPSDIKLLKELDKGKLASLGNWETWTWLEEEETANQA